MRISITPLTQGHEPSSFQWNGMNFFMQVLFPSQLQWQQDCPGHSTCCCCSMESQNILLGWEGVWPCPDREPQNSPALLCGCATAVFHHPRRDLYAESYRLQLPTAVHAGVCPCGADLPCHPVVERVVPSCLLSCPVTHLHLSFP